MDFVCATGTCQLAKLGPGLPHAVTHTRQGLFAPRIQGHTGRWCWVQEGPRREQRGPHGVFSNGPGFRPQGKGTHRETPCRRFVLGLGTRGRGRLSIYLCRKPGTRWTRGWKCGEPLEVALPQTAAFSRQTMTAVRCPLVHSREWPWREDGDAK